MNLQWLSMCGICPVQHHHRADPTCGTGTPPPGAESGPHTHIGSTTCYSGKGGPGACNVPHWHLNDPTRRPA